MGKFRFLVLIFISLIVYSSFLFPGPRVANDFPDLSEEVVKKNYDIPRIWKGEYNGFGSYAVSTMWSWPVDFLYAFGANAGFSFSVLYRFLGIFTFLILGFYSISKLLSLYEISRNGKFVASLFYLINTYILLVIDGGQYRIALAYAFLPLAFFSIIDSFGKPFYKKIIAAILVTLLGYFDIRFVYILFLLTFIYVLTSIFFSSFRNLLFLFSEWTKIFAAIFIVFVSINSYWILPALLVKPPSLPVGYDRVSEIEALSFANLTHSLFVISPHWYKNSFGEIASINPIFAIVPMLVFLSPVLFRGNKNIAFWFLAALVFVFLVKGNLKPFGFFYEWLFTNIPGFSMFRDPTKFFFLVCLSFSVLIGFAITGLEEKYKLHLKIKKIKMPIFSTLFVFIWFILMYPSYTGLMTGTLSTPVYLNEFSKIKEHLLSDQNFGRVLYIPQRPPLGYATLEHPAISAYNLLTIRPFATGVVGTYEKLNFLRDSSYVDQFLEIAGIKYVVYPFYDTRKKEISDDERKYYFTFLSQLQNSNWFNHLIQDYPVAFLQTKKSKDLIYLANETIAIIGSDKIYEEIDLLDIDISKNPLLFIEEFPNLNVYLQNGTIKKAILYDKNLLDFHLSFVSTDRYIFPSNSLDFSPSSKVSWWKRESIDFLWWRYFLQDKYSIDNIDFDYGGGWAVAEGETELDLYDKSIKDKGILYARVLLSDKGGKISFLQGNREIGFIETKIDNPPKIVRTIKGYEEEDKHFSFNGSNFLWFKVGELIADEKVSIKTSGDINVINSLVVLDRDELSKIEYFSKGIQIIKWSDMNDSAKKNLFLQKSKKNGNLSYEKINSTEYLIKVDGLDGKGTVVFTNSYDGLWLLNASQSFPVYSFANGFSISSSGSYRLAYYPQKFVNFGFYLTRFFAVFAMILLLASFFIYKIRSGKK